MREGWHKYHRLRFLDDGAMDLWLFEGDTLGDTIQRAWDLYAGRHVDSEKVQRISIQAPDA